MTQSHCVSSSGSHDECRTAPDGCQPLDQADRFEQYCPACMLENYIHHRHLLLLSLKGDTHFTVPQIACSRLLLDSGPGGNRTCNL